MKAHNADVKLPIKPAMLFNVIGNSSDSRVVGTDIRPKQSIINIIMDMIGRG